MRRVLGIYRETEFSPGKVEADAAILDEVLGLLSAAGFETTSVAPAEFVNGPLARFSDIELVLAMCQSLPALARLRDIENSGSVTINSPGAIRNCYRDRLDSKLRNASIPTPRAFLVSTVSAFADIASSFDFRAGVFVKRGDLHALSANDVVKVSEPERLPVLLSGFAARGVKSVLLQQALAGDVVKFYGVGHDQFFRLADGAGRPEPGGLSQIAARAAAVLGLEVWGGDAIVENGSVSLVDLNDWPSFASVRAEAADAIASRAIELIPDEAPKKGVFGTR
jgi:glutathione synthase/RimK-type ligase-like ATP-grasp enzyme